MTELGLHSERGCYRTLEVDVVYISINVVVRSETIGFVVELAQAVRKVVPNAGMHKLVAVGIVSARKARRKEAEAVSLEQRIELVQRWCGGAKPS